MFKVQFRPFQVKAIVLILSHPVKMFIPVCFKCQLQLKSVTPSAFISPGIAMNIMIGCFFKHDFILLIEICNKPGSFIYFSPDIAISYNGFTLQNLNVGFNFRLG